MVKNLRNEDQIKEYRINSLASEINKNHRVEPNKKINCYNENFLYILHHIVKENKELYKQLS